VVDLDEEDGHGLPETTTIRAGPTLELALIRMPAVDQASRTGSLFVNPGGPGASGVEFLRQVGAEVAPLDARFDVVAWDPRGVGASTPAIDCDITDRRRGAAAIGRGARAVGCAGPRAGLGRCW